MSSRSDVNFLSKGLRSERGWHPRQSRVRAGSFHHSMQILGRKIANWGPRRYKCLEEKAMSFRMHPES